MHEAPPPVCSGRRHMHEAPAPVFLDQRHMHPLVGAVTPADAIQTVEGLLGFVEGSQIGVAFEPLVDGPQSGRRSFSGGRRSCPGGAASGCTVTWATPISRSRRMATS